MRNVSSWSEYLPEGQIQSNGVSFETDCTTWSMLHCVETQVNYLYATGQLSTEAIQYFNSAGYIVNGKFKCSDLFNAILNGTSLTGNYQNTVQLSVLAVGLLPWNDLPLPAGEDWNQYMSTPITQEMKIKAQQIFKYLTITAKWVYGPVTREILSVAPVQLAIRLCQGYSTDNPVPACTDAPPQHVIMQYGLDGGIQIFDTILPFQKTLAADYGNFGVMQYIVTPVNPMQKPVYTFTATLQQGSTNSVEITALQTFLVWDGEMDASDICGIFGPLTLAAVNEFQVKYGIPAEVGLSSPTGIWGTHCISKANQLLTS